MTGKMKGLVLYDRGKSEVREVDIPSAGESDIIIRVDSTTICGGDVHAYNGTFPFRKEVILGHEFAGTIVEMGPRADKRFKVGDRVVSENTIGVCGTCPACEQGNYVNCPNRRTLGFSADGCFTEYVKIPGEVLEVYKHALWALPDEIGMEEAPLLEPASNGYMSIIQEGHLMPGQNVVIYGAGPIGLYALEWAVVGGAGNVFMIGMEADEKTRFPMAMKLGATKCFVNRPEDNEKIQKEISDIVGEDGIALIAECAGHPSCLKQAIQIVRNDGIIIRVGMNDTPLDIGLNIINGKSISIVGHMGYNPTSWRHTINMVKLGKYDLKSLITHRLPLSRIKEGFDMLKDQEAIKIAIKTDE